MFGAMKNMLKTHKNLKQKYQSVGFLLECEARAVP